MKYEYDTGILVSASVAAPNFSPSSVQFRGFPSLSSDGAAKLLRRRRRPARHQGLGGRPRRGPAQRARSPTTSCSAASTPRAGSPLAVGVGVSPGPRRLVGEDDPAGDAALGDAEPCRHGLGGRARPGLLGRHRSSSGA